MANSTDQTDRLGIHAVGAIFTQLKWAFREQSTSDYGIDAQAEKLNPDGKGGGKLIALQIKTGASYFRKKGDDYVYYGEERHREYWINHSLPVFLIMHNPEMNLTLWQRVERHLIEEGKDGRWSIMIPANQTLDQQHEQYIAAGIASDLSSLRRARLALDLSLIKKIIEQKSEVYLRIEDWVNKTLNYRSANFVFSENPDDDVDVTVDAWMPGYSIAYYMAVVFPWLDWERYEYRDEDEGGGEVAEHVLKVEVSEVGKAVLLLETFYQSELPPFRPEPEEVAAPSDWEYFYHAADDDHR